MSKSKSPLVVKIVTLIGTMLLLLIPLMVIRGLIVERADYRGEVEEAISRSTSGPQKLVGPLIAIPVTEMYTTLENNHEVSQKRTFIHFWLPESLMVEGNQNVEPRKVGIYEGQVWKTDVNIKAEFDTSRLESLNHANITLGKPFMVMAVGDTRGIGVVNAPGLDGTPLQVEPGTGIAGEPQGLHVKLPDFPFTPKKFNLDFSLVLSGTGNFSVVPLGRNSELVLNSNWPHPNFIGDFLPVKREVSPTGFQARWQSSWFANNLGEQFADADKFASPDLPSFNVAVATPADHYQLTDRATKYALLLIALTFTAFFVFEMLTGRRMHPIQYLLVGLSLVMFYFLLLALSEHIGFTTAWVAASLVGALMNGVYLQAVLKSWRSSLLFTLALLVLDGVMWALLRSEEISLLLGTGVLLMALCGVMFLTRNLDWYALGSPKAAGLRESDELRIWK
ncbi:cell envelope integrity protein CreD [Pseudocitrobacter sp. RIT415]|uniref:cell envelope integrity protein CreD n=1 Tax=Pseudocitrobacter sp. RIT415 TaxID=2202163 RepID=UPI000D3A8ABC|nr:cell envelope integrity protein CreD [Pseudocitrobacter sp. RIT 415]RAU50464.1 cell envelope integrity protein CreD [Pseudocitrobacter sp. RIT 415]